MGLYDRAFFEQQSDGSYESAVVIVPLVLTFLPVASVCDVGCGGGTWLKAFEENGVVDVLGVDSHQEQASLRIAAERFRFAELARPFELERRFDLALSIEVAEHLPASAADDFVASLTRLADAVLFSAAIPGQGGVGHVNEQWQSYWAERFDRFDYLPLDVVRPAVWQRPEVRWWHKQNVLLYAKRGTGAAALEAHAAQALDLVHPECYVQHLEPDLESVGFSTVARLLPRLAVRAMGRVTRSRGSKQP